MSATIEQMLGPKSGEILEAAGHLAMFQQLVVDHGLTGEDVSRGMSLINVDERTLIAGGAKT